MTLIIGSISGAVLGFEGVHDVPTVCIEEGYI
jgi:hypothetical protein